MVRRPPAIEDVVRARVRELRAVQGMTQEQLCEAAGISVDAVNRIENGTRIPTLPTLSALARALGVDVADLVRTDRIPPPTLPPPVHRLAASLAKQPDPVQEAAERMVQALLSVVSR
jgi:transcriptional regulator with XRE-family HTH domain